MKKHLIFVFILAFSILLLASCQKTTDIICCDECGEPLNEKAKFCYNCGSSTESKNNEENNIIDQVKEEIASAYINHLKGDEEFGDVDFAHYCFYDIDGDKYEELIIKAGTCEADSVILIYKYQNGNVIQMGSTNGSHGNIYGINNDVGIIVFYGHQGVEHADKITIIHNNLQVDEMFSMREVDEYTEIPNTFTLSTCPINDMSILIDAGGVDLSKNNTNPLIVKNFIGKWKDISILGSRVPADATRWNVEFRSDGTGTFEFVFEADDIAVVDFEFEPYDTYLGESMDGILVKVDSAPDIRYMVKYTWSNQLQKILMTMFEVNNNGTPNLDVYWVFEKN